MALGNIVAFQPSSTQSTPAEEAHVVYHALWCRSTFGFRVHGVMQRNKSEGLEWQHIHVGLSVDAALGGPDLHGCTCQLIWVLHEGEGRPHTPQHKVMGKGARDGRALHHLLTVNVPSQLTQCWQMAWNVSDTGWSATSLLAVLLCIGYFL